MASLKDNTIINTGKNGEKRKKMSCTKNGVGLKEKSKIGRRGGKSRKGKNSEERKDLNKTRRRSKHLTRNSRRGKQVKCELK